ncbi:MAG: ABC transporter substrate-binding protein [Oscillospiraceae bacterium]|jgi:raffinose/stachyose/melibiose transport system substrate-binding protein|nr:ABC transporter substrate-binding protein [Oscillospiraceae bacterium]
MKKMKRILALAVAALTAAASLSACSSNESASSASPQASSGQSSAESSGAKEIFFLNFKPEIAEVYKEVAADYEKETGVKVNVVTAASGTYEQTLKSDMAKSDAPTIFQINGPVGYATWKDYCADVKGTELYSHLMDKSLAVTDGTGVYGIPYVVEGYGIIYNDAVMKKYFALSDKAVSIDSADQIKNFDTLKAVVEDMTKHKADLGIDGVFASTSLSTGEDWRWQTHLLNLPMYYEFKDADADKNTVVTGLASKEITFQYADQYKNIFDLYLNNSATKKGLLGSKSVDDSMAEFALGKVAMVQNGNWAWSQINGVSGNVVKAEDIKFMPIYTGTEGEENQGLCIGTENYFCINSKVSEAKQKASEEFLNWLYTSDTGKNYVTNKLNFIAPFDSFSDDERPSDPLAKEVTNWMSKKDIQTIPWTFECFPSQDYKNKVGASLLEYAQGGKDWNNVKSVVVNEWKAEKAKS